MLHTRYRSTQEIELLVREFEARTLPKASWTHHAHLVVAHWYLTRHSHDETLEILRRRIRAYNEATGTPNTDYQGYHETLTRLFLRGVAQHIGQHANLAFIDSVHALLDSPLARTDWPLRFYTRQRLFSVEARQRWIDPDQEPG